MAQSHATKFSGIFICYRRDDSSGHAGRLLDRLVDHFGKDRIFMDIDIEPGEDFVTLIENAVSSCKILIAIIGRHWLSEARETTRRLDNPKDFVRLEIATALRRDIRVVPVLVQRASMPKPEDLPEDLKKLARRNEIELSDLRWQSDVDRLIVVMEKVLAREENERHKAEEERLLQEAETRRREDEARLQREAAERQHHQEETARRAEEKRRQGALEAERERAKVPETILSPQSSTVNSQESHLVSPQSQTANPTLTYPAPNAHARIDMEAPSPRPLTASGRVLALVRGRPIALAIVIVAIMAAGFLILAMLHGSDNENPPVNNPKGSDNKTPQPVPPEGMVYVPGGRFTMGRDNGDDYERPAHAVTVNPFLIDTCEVTNQDYGRFVKATGHQPPANWPAKTYPIGAARKPVTGVNWDDAVAYARWIGKRLPTEEQWEFAARGTDGRRYPWANTWRAGVANVDSVSNGTAEVGTYSGASPFGAFDMVGNAWEWTSSDWAAYPGGYVAIRSYNNPKVIRGGAVFDAA